MFSKKLKDTPKTKANVTIIPDIMISVTKENNIYHLIVKEKATIMIDLRTNEIQNYEKAINDYFGKPISLKINNELKTQLIS